MPRKSLFSTALAPCLRMSGWVIKGRTFSRGMARPTPLPSRTQVSLHCPASGGRSLGPDAADFVLDSSSSAALAPGATTSFCAPFTSAALGARVAIIRIFSNHPDENPFEIILSGSGGFPKISIMTASPASGSITLLENSRVHPWGANITTPVGLSSVQAIAAGDSYTVALKADGTVVAWGANGVKG